MAWQLVQNQSLTHLIPVGGVLAKDPSQFQGVGPHIEIRAVTVHEREGPSA